MLQTQTVVELNFYRNLRIMNQRFGQYYQYLEVDKLSYFLNNCHYHILVSPHSDEQLINVIVTNKFFYNRHPMVEIGSSNCVFVYPMDKFPFQVEAALSSGNRVHIYYSQNLGAYCMEQLQAGVHVDEVLKRITNRAYYATIYDMMFEVKQQGPAKILQYHLRKELL